MLRPPASRREPSQDPPCGEGPLCSRAPRRSRKILPEEQPAKPPLLPLSQVPSSQLPSAEPAPSDQVSSPRDHWDTAWQLTYIPLQRYLPPESPPTQRTTPSCTDTSIHPRTL
ncbi:unnamed protein product [Gulo gulo]|uniref:Uncharacterized protein n=1 Tax=Gulo gulo TaxID=48420 RepID=A0A9X9MD08_GULGU|nr:unnamed protein product [Gulo gulo]